MDNGRTGALIRALRQEKGLTQKQLADALHLSDRAVSKWERGLCAPDLSTLEPLAEALGTTVAELITGRRAGEAGVETAVRETVAYSRQELAKKTRRSRWRTVLACMAPVLVIALVLFFVTMPSTPSGIRKDPELAVAPFGAGEGFTLYAADMYMTVAPTHEYFWTALTVEEIMENIDRYNLGLTQDRRRLGTASDGSERWLLTAPHPLTGKNDYLGFVSYGQVTTDNEVDGLSRYGFLDGSVALYLDPDRDDPEETGERRVLFPAVLIDDPEPYFLVLRDGETYPVLPGWTAEETADFLEGYYQSSRWCTVEREGDGTLAVSPAPWVDVSGDPDDRELFCERTFLLAVEERGAGCMIRLTGE